MNEIKIKEIKQIYFVKSPKCALRSSVNFFAEFEDNLFLNEKNKLRLRELGSDYIMVQKDLIIKADKDVIENFKNFIENEKEKEFKVGVNVNFESKYEDRKKTAIDEQIYAEKFIDIDFYEFEEKKETFVIKLKEELFDEEITYQDIQNKIRKSFDPFYNIPDHTINIHLNKKEAIVEKTTMRKITEHIVKNTDKKLIYREWSKLCLFEFDNSNCEIKEIKDILRFLNTYEECYTIIEYQGDKTNPIIKGIYIKSELFLNRLYFIKIENLLNFLLSRNLKEYDERNYENIKKYLNVYVVSKMVGNF